MTASLPVPVTAADRQAAADALAERAARLPTRIAAFRTTAAGGTA